MKKLPLYFLPFISGLVLLISLTFTSCSSEKEIIIELPPYEPELVIQSYLIPGLPFVVQLQESDAYLAEPDLPVIENAEVYICYDGQCDTLFHTTSGIYSTTALVPIGYEGTFQLFVNDPQGRTATASTRILPVAEIDQLEYEFEASGEKALVRVTFDDFAGERNFYRYVLHENSLLESQKLSFEVSDEFFQDGAPITLSSFYGREPGDTCFVTLYHIEEEYFNYLETIEDARDANGNPFAQPVIIHSNIEGGTGIFTGLSFDLDTIVIPSR